MGNRQNREEDEGYGDDDDDESKTQPSERSSRKTQQKEKQAARTSTTNVANSSQAGQKVGIKGAKSASKGVVPPTPHETQIQNVLNSTTGAIERIEDSKEKDTINQAKNQIVAIEETHAIQDQKEKEKQAELQLQLAKTEREMTEEKRKIAEEHAILQQAKETFARLGNQLGTTVT